MSAPFAPSMPAGSHEMRDYYSNQDPPRSTPHTAPSITPYLGLRARLSQVPINRWTILLLLVLARTLIAIASIDHDLGSARREALDACGQVESMGSTMASMPHYMSQGVNELTAKGIEKSVNGLMSMTTMSVSAVEEITVFVIGMMTNTYLCLITMGVHGALEGVSSVLQKSQDDINKLTKSVTGEISDTMGDFGDAYKKLQSAIKGVSFGLVKVEIPDLPNFTAQRDALTSFKLPADLSAPFVKLNQSIPDFAGVKNVTEGFIRLPFDEVKELISNFTGNYTFDRDFFPIPAKEQLTFCSDSDGINDFFDKLEDMTSLFKKIFISVLIAAAIIVMFPMGWREIKRYRKQQERTPLVLSAAHDPMDVTYLVSRPYTSSAGLWMSRTPPSAISSASRKQQLIRWAVAYCTSEAALFVLTLALAGFFACLCQIILLRAISSKTPELADQVGSFADKVLNQLNNASEQWQVGVNAAVKAESDKINREVLGWVNITTGAINGTINKFVNETSTVLNEVFGGTPLYEPIKDVLDCLVLLKIQGVQKALTWVSDHAHVDFPQLPNDTFSLGALASLGNDTPSDDSFLSSSGDKASDKITAAVTRFTASLENGIRIEALVSTVVLCIWIFVALVGFAYALFKMIGSDKTRGMGGAPPMEEQYGGGVAPVRPAYPHSVMSMPRNDFTSDGQDQFVDVPLANVNNNRNFDNAPPLPEYKEREVSPERPRRTAEKNPFDDRMSEVSLEEDNYQEQRLGYGGERNSTEKSFHKGRF